MLVKHDYCDDSCLLVGWAIGFRFLFELISVNPTLCLVCCLKTGKLLDELILNGKQNLGLLNLE